jgi:hypothetical protein
MPLWYNTGTGLKPTSFERDNLNLDVFFCCSGPSLGEVDPLELKGPGRLVLGVNNSYPYVSPDIWLGADDPSCYPREIFWEPFIKIMRGGYNNRGCSGKKINGNFNTYYADVLPPESQEEMFSKGDGVSFVWNNNVIAVALHLLFWMGAKRIYFVGCDLDNKGKDYNHEQKLSLDNKAWAMSLYNDLFDWFKWLVPAAGDRGIQIKSCTRGSRINDIMEYVKLEDALSRSQEGIPFNKDLIYGRDVK